MKQNPIVKRVLSSELALLKTDCAQLSNDVRELVLGWQTALKPILDAFQQQCDQLQKERDEAVRLHKIEEGRRREYLNQLHALKGNIRVICRIRPINKIDEEKGSKEVAVSRISREVARCDGKDFEFDEVFGPQHTNVEIFDEVLPMVESIFDGHHACIFAYGQTGSGKTFTMTGTSKDLGVNYRAIDLLFERRSLLLANGLWSSVTFHVSNVEIYNETVRDLLNEANELQIRQDLHQGVHVPECTRIKAENIRIVHETMAFGQKNRAQALTKMNSESSRSHSVFIIDVECQSYNEEIPIIQGRLVLVDLAGSERLSKSGVSGDREKEARNINKSLSTLGAVIKSLGSKNSHVPFRDSKLTYLLQDSMGAQNKVMMIVQAAPTIYNVQESVCTLKFGCNARAVELGRAQTRTAPIVIQKPNVNAKINDFVNKQKLLAAESCREEAEARALRAEKESKKKDELLAKLEKEREDLLNERRTQCKVFNFEEKNRNVLKQQVDRKLKPARKSGGNIGLSQSYLTSKQIEMEQAKIQVKARLEEQERNVREARERMVPMVTPTRHTFAPVPVKTQPVPTPTRQVFASLSLNNQHLPTPPPLMVSKIPVSATSTISSTSSFHGDSFNFQGKRSSFLLNNKENDRYTRPSLGGGPSRVTTEQSFSSSKSRSFS